MHYFSGKGCSEFLESMHYCIGILISSAKYSLGVYAKLRDTLKELKIEPKDYKWITDMYPEVPLTEFVLRNTKPQIN